MNTLEKATLVESIARTYRSAPQLARFDGERLKALSGRMELALVELRTLNGDFAIETCRARFRENMALVQATDHGTTESGRHAAYRNGCRVLEHQFALTRPSKSLRELLTGESGAVLRDLKPIWMMSPLSVADTLPFSDDLFDAVIFDEASQIPLEDAVPSLYRARQTIIVGDEMQLPPTSFFASAAESGEPLPDYLAYAVSADSLLTKAATALASTKLTWHYRSRHESLISFCNRAFYGGELNTVPSRRPLKAEAEIRIRDLPIPKRAQAKLADGLLSRPVSLHHVETGIFRNQQNEAEADYVAELIRSQLKKKTGKSIGVVAFSQQQAQAIEAAMEGLAATDRVFANLMETEREREIDGQFSGLFVKNLERLLTQHVQGIDIKRALDQRYQRGFEGQLLKRLTIGDRLGADIKFRMRQALRACLLLRQDGLGLRQVGFGIGILEVGDDFGETADRYISAAGHDEASGIAVDLRIERQATGRLQPHDRTVLAPTDPVNKSHRRVMPATFILVELVVRNLVAQQIKQFVLIEQLKDAAAEFNRYLTRDIVQRCIGRAAGILRLVKHDVGSEPQLVSCR